MNILVPVEFKNQRIISTKLLAEQFGTEDKIISNNFNRNIDRFVEGKHYYKLEGEALKEFKQGYHLNDESLKFVSILYMWTEKGVARHAKILDTDEAWEVYERLEESYFRVQSRQLTAMEQLKLQYEVLAEHDAKFEEVDNRINNLEGKMTIDHGQACDIKLAVNLRVRILCCGNESGAYQNVSIRSKVYRYIWKNLKEYFCVTAYHNLLRKDLDIVLTYIRSIKLEGSLLREVQQANNQMYFGGVK